MGNNVKLNIEGITNTKNVVKQVLLYINNAKQELKNINLSNNEEFDSELIKTINDINAINANVEDVDNWIDEVTNKFEQAEVSSIKAIENATINKVNTVSFSASKNAIPNANVKLGKRVAPPTETSGKSKGLGDLLKDTLAKVVEAVVNAVKSYTNSKENNNSKSSNSNNSKSSNSSNTSDKKAERNWKEEAEETNRAFLKGIIEAMQKVVSFSIKQGRNMLEQSKTLNPSISTGSFDESSGKKTNYAFYDPGNQSNVLLVYLPGWGNYGYNTKQMMEGKNADVFAKNVEKISPDVNVLFLQSSSYHTFRNESQSKNDQLFVDIIKKFSEEHGCDSVILSGYSAGAHTTTYLANLVQSEQEPFNEIKDLVKGTIIVSGMEKKYEREGTSGQLEDLPTLVVLGTRDHSVKNDETLDGLSYLFHDGDIRKKYGYREIQSPYTDGNATLMWNDWDHMQTPNVFQDEFLWNWVHEVSNKGNGTVSEKDIEKLERIEKNLEVILEELNENQESNVKPESNVKLENNVKQESNVKLENNAKQESNIKLESDAKQENNAKKEKSNIEYKAGSTELSENINEEEYQKVYEDIKSSINKELYAKAYSEAFEIILSSGKTMNENEFIDTYKKIANEAFEKLNKEGLTQEEKEMYKKAYEEVYKEIYTKAYNSAFLK